MLKESYYTEPTEMDKLVFEKLVLPEHSLYQVNRLIDFERLLDFVKNCYSPAIGRTADDLVWLGTSQQSLLAPQEPHLDRAVIDFVYNTSIY